MGKPNGDTGFFAVERKLFQAACAGGLNQAVTFLVLARGTGRNHAKTSWSVQSIETYTGISRPRAHTAIQGLIERNVIRQDNGGTRPSYTLLRSNSDQDSLVWLPNALVTGVAGEIPPIELIRQTQDVQTLQLLVDVYHTQNLRSDGGIHWRMLRQEWRRLQVGQQGPFVVWGFSSMSPVAWREAPFVSPHIRGKKKGTKNEIEDWENSWEEFWLRWKVQIKLGLVEYVGHLIESDTSESEVIHPYAVAGGESIEKELAHAAHEAGLCMVTEGQYAWASKEFGAEPWLVPIPAHIKDVQLVGIPRLRYRPHTKMTAAWYGKTMNYCTDYLERYRALTPANHERGRASAG